MGKSVTPTVESGLLVAITVILGAVSFFIPIFGMFVEFFCAVPLAVLTTRQGVGKGLTATVVSFILLAMLISPIPALRLALSFGLCGVALGWGVRKNFDAIRIFFTLLVVSSAAQVFTLLLLIAVVDANFIDTQIAMLRESFAESFAMYEAMGVDAERIAEAKSQVEPALQTLLLIIPTIMLINALLTAAATWLTAHWIFPKLQMKLPTLPPFAEWRFPVLFFYTATIGGLGLYIQMISLNLMLVSGFIGLIQGFALLSALFDRHNVSKFVRRLIYAVLLLNLFFIQLVAITGLIDMLFDYRKKFFRGGD